MTLHSWIREYVKRYSFVIDTEFKNAVLHIFYEVDGNVKQKKLPYRATKEQLVRCIESIKKEIDYYAKKKERDAKVNEAVREKESAIVYTHR